MNDLRALVLQACSSIDSSVKIDSSVTRLGHNSADCSSASSTSLRMLFETSASIKQSASRS